MRLTSIDVEGFQSYRDLQRIDLGRIDRAVIVGENGAGKSTLFDVIEFALFGRIRTPKKHGVISTGREKTFTAVEFILADTGTASRGRCHGSKRKKRSSTSTAARGSGSPSPATRPDRPTRRSSTSSAWTPTSSKRPSYLAKATPVGWPTPNRWNGDDCSANYWDSTATKPSTRQRKRRSRSSRRAARRLPDVSTPWTASWPTSAPSQTPTSPPPPRHSPLPRTPLTQHKPPRPRSTTRPRTPRRSRRSDTTWTQRSAPTTNASPCSPVRSSGNRTSTAARKARSLRPKLQRPPLTPRRANSHESTRTSPTSSKRESASPPTATRSFHSASRRRRTSPEPSTTARPPPRTSSSSPHAQTGYAAR
ncbi:AAA family ATPase [Rhodococcus hoagii]|nr:AAA family ATPase [Prescottella equi]